MECIDDVSFLNRYIFIEIFMYIKELMFFELLNEFFDSNDESVLIY